MGNPYGIGFDSEEENKMAAQKAAVCSGKKDAEIKERSRTILDYYAKGKRKRVWND